MYLVLEPEIAGSLGERSVVDASSHPPRVSKLHYVMDGWLGDDILESFPCYLVSDRLRAVLEQGGLTGYQCAAAEVTLSEQFQELHAGRNVPTWCWLKITGQAGVDDFGRGKDHRLVVSQRALSLMQRGGSLEHCEIAEFPEG